ncbi:hypothetical protein QYF36_025754 [Acer negundo]|nr:hypothetical protein QYF36_025754 [Acer negundo]
MEKEKVVLRFLTTAWLLWFKGNRMLQGDTLIEHDNFVKGRFGVGVVIRDDKGVIVMADALSWFWRVSVEVAEAKAILEGLLFTERKLIQVSHFQ